MPRRYRRIILAAFGCTVAVGLSLALSLWLIPRQIPLTGNTAVEPVVSQRSQADAGCAPAEIRLLPQYVQAHKTEACKVAAEDRQSERNSYVQARRSADATDAQAKYAFQQTRIAAVGAGLDLVTMLAAITAAFYAGIAAYQAKRSANIADNAFEADHRAWVDITVDIPSGGEFKWGDEYSSLPVEVKIRNYGASPAHSVRWWLEAFADPFRAEERANKVIREGEPRDGADGETMFPDSTPVIHLEEARVFDMQFVREGSAGSPHSMGVSLVLYTTYLPSGRNSKGPARTVRLYSVSHGSYAIMRGNCPIDTSELKLRLWQSTAL